MSMFTAEIDRDPVVPGTARRNVARGAARIGLANAFSVDVEDYFQVEAFKGIVDRKSWNELPGRVEGSTERVLALLDDAGVFGTFFILGWVATKYPELVRRIVEGGHEIASHGFGHDTTHHLSPAEFRNDVRRAKCILEDCAGVRICGFRAPTFSIGRKTWWAYEVMAEEGYSYSSSIYPISHDLYGVPDAPRVPFRPISGCDFVEIPIATVRLFGRNRPCGGGGYFRLIPYPVSRWCIGRVNRIEGWPCVFYCHPWEFDPRQPRFHEAPLKSRLRHYLNLSAMEHRVARLLKDHEWGRIDKIFLASGYASKVAVEWTA
ncbi:MAG TPA: XrtA system polysaccharide deacetylase [Rhizomicrobium sp.]|jgi:polysaccharide deacetylase family protein (PEP-CTERM system associated)|nr:XrtA system polysaccharide deacetylase [Rhizomicrobium sp.]